MRLPTRRRRLRLLLTGAGIVVVALLALAVVLSHEDGAESESEYAQEAFAAGTGEDPDAAAGAEGEAGGEGHADQPGALDRFFYEARAYPGERISLAKSRTAGRAYRSHPTRLPRSAFKSSGKAPVFDGSQSSLGTTWSLSGPITPTIASGQTNFYPTPTTYSGRVTAMVIAPTCTAGNCRMWIGAAGGGVWRTNDALATNPTWTSASSGIPISAIGSLALDPNNPAIIYAGTGEANQSSDSQIGSGLYKSTDSGNTWSLVANTDAQAKGRAISSITIDPTDSNQVYFGTASAGSGYSGRGGQTFSPPGAATAGVYKVGTPSAIITGSTAQVALDPLNPSTLYLSSEAGGLYRVSFSGGPDGDTGLHQIFGGSDTGAAATFSLTAKSGHTRIYAGTGGTSSASTEKLYRVDDADTTAFGSLWTGSANTAAWAVIGDSTNLQSGGICAGQCWYDRAIYSPPGSPDTVFYGGSMSYSQVDGSVSPVDYSNGRAMIRSTNAGATWTDMTQDGRAPGTRQGLHPDVHAIATGGNRVFVGGDGGVSRLDLSSTTDISSECASRPGPPSGASLTACTQLLSAVPAKIENVNDGLATLQVTGVSAAPNADADAGKNLMLGTQDNGSWALVGTNPWTGVVGGDGGPPALDSQSGIRLTQYFNGFVNGSPGPVLPAGSPPDVGLTSGTWKGVSYTGDTLFYAPLIDDPAVSGRFLQGGTALHKLDCSGATVPALSCSATNVSVPFGSSSNRISTVARPPSATDTNTIWVGTQTGDVAVSTDGTTFNAIGKSVIATVPNRFVSGIAVDPSDPNHAWVSFTGYSASTPSRPGHVFEVQYNPTTPSASTWTDRSYDLGDLPVTSLARDPNTGDLYGGTEFGVVRLPTGATAWARAAAGMPIVNVVDVEVSAGDRRLYAASYGRGLYKIKLPSNPSAIITAPPHIYVGRSASFSAAQSRTYDDQVPAVHWEFPGGSTSNQVSAAYTPQQTGAQTVTLTTSDSEGRQTVTNLPVNATAPPCVVPKVTGQKLAKAKTAIVKAGCAVGKISKKKGKKGKVLAQKPKASATELAPLTKVKLTVGKGNK